MMFLTFFIDEMYFSFVIGNNSTSSYAICGYFLDDKIRVVTGQIVKNNGNIIRIFVI